MIELTANDLASVNGILAEIKNIEHILKSQRQLTEFLKDKIELMLNNQ